jgi:hypothetical protein
MFTIDDIIKSKNLEELFIKVTEGKNINKISNKDILRSIRNFCPIYTSDIDSFLDDKNVINELEKYGRYSLINYVQSKQKM